MSPLIAYAIIAACGIGVLVLGAVTVRAQRAHGRWIIAEMEARHAREIAEEERMLADYWTELVSR